MWTHTIKEAIPSAELLLAVTEPDDTGTRYYIARVRHRHLDGQLVTDISYLPLPDIPTPPLIRDAWGPWVDPDAVKADADGVMRLVDIHA